MNWSNDKREILRLALQNVYTDYDLLEIFVDEKLDANLPDIAEKAELTKVTYKLLKWAKSENRLDELFRVFCLDNPRVKDSVIAKLQSQPLIDISVNLQENDWDTLIVLFSPNDSAYMQVAFRRAFKAVYDQAFWDVRPDCPPMDNPDSILNLLVQYDKPLLAVRFVEFAIAELRRSDENNERDFTALENWRDRIAQEFDIDPFVPVDNQEQPAIRHAYLLVALERHGAKVNVYPELHIMGEGKPTGFGATPTNCSIDEVADYLSAWIEQAEEALGDDPSIHEEVILEVFLPCQDLEEDIASTWFVRDRRGAEVTLGMHRRFLVRSSDRIRDRKIQKALQRKWEALNVCVQEQNACREFHIQRECPGQKGVLCALLKDIDATGLKFLVHLPSEPSKRIDLINEMIDAALPIALWPSEMADVDPNNLRVEFDALLNCQLTNFADLARQWRRRRIEAASANHIRLLCDRPDRWPRLPDSDHDGDALVAS